MAAEPQPRLLTNAPGACRAPTAPRGAGRPRGSLPPSPTPAHAGAAAGSLAGSLAAALGFTLRAPAWAQPGPRAGGRVARPVGSVGGSWAAGAGRPAGSVTGCVCLGLAGRQLRDGRQEELQVICDGERGQWGVCRGWRGAGEPLVGSSGPCPGRGGLCSLCGQSTETFWGHVGRWWPAPSGSLLAVGRAWGPRGALAGGVQRSLCTWALTSALFLSTPALEGAVNDGSIFVSSLAAQTLMIMEAVVREPPSRFCLQAPCSWLRRAWRRRSTAGMPASPSC